MKQTINLTKWRKYKKAIDRYNAKDYAKFHMKAQAEMKAYNKKVEKVLKIIGD